MGKFRGTARTGLAVLALVALQACTADYRTHGWMPPEEDLQMIVPGVDSKASVEDLIGVPTTSGVLNDSGFYYVESEVRRFAWQRPEVVNRRILAITFDESGIVDNITEYGLEDGQVVTLQRRITTTPDSNIGFIRRLFGNIGGLSAESLFN